MSAAGASGAAGIAGGIFSALGGITSGEAGGLSATAAGESAAYSAQVARNNAIIAGYNATEAEQAGEVQAQATSFAGAQQGAKIKTAQAANNIDVNTGSAKNVEVSQAETSQLDTETVLNNQELQAYGYRAAATSYGAESGLLTTQAAEAPVGAALGAGGGLLAGASSVGLKWAGSSGTTPGQPLNILPQVA